MPDGPKTRRLSQSSIDIMTQQAARTSWAYPKVDRRRKPRWQTDLPARLLVRAMAGDCRVRDISQGGARVVTDVAVEEDEIIVLELDDIDPLAARVVHLSDGTVGLMFLYDSDQRQQVVDWITPKLNG